MRIVLADVDSSIRAWLTDELSAGIDIAFDPPPRSETRSRAPQVNLFLYAITEDLDGMPAAPLRLRAADGRQTGTMAPPRSYHLSYLVTAWASGVAEEHELLGAVIGAHAENDVLDQEHLRGTLRDLDSPLPIRVGWSPAGAAREIWTALGVPMRTSVELTVTAPALPSRLKPLAPPVEDRVISVHDTVRRRRWERRPSTDS